MEGFGCERCSCGVFLECPYIFPYMSFFPCTRSIQICPTFAKKNTASTSMNRSNPWPSLRSPSSRGMWNASRPAGKALRSHITQSCSVRVICCITITQIHTNTVYQCISYNSSFLGNSHEYPNPTPGVHMTSSRHCHDSPLSVRVQAPGRNQHANDISKPQLCFTWLSP